MQLVVNRLLWSEGGINANARSLKSLLYAPRDFACSDPRDKVFALLGLAQLEVDSFPRTYSSDDTKGDGAAIDAVFGPRAYCMACARTFRRGFGSLYSYDDVRRPGADVAKTLSIIDPMSSDEKDSLARSTKQQNMEPGGREILKIRYLEDLSADIAKFPGEGIPVDENQDY